MKIIDTSIYILVLTIFFSVFRMLKGSTWDILLGYSSMSSKATLLMITLGVFFQKDWALDISLIYMLLSAGSVVIISYFMGRRNLS